MHPVTRTGLAFTRQLFLELLIFFHISSFINSAKDSTHFLRSASTISFPVCTTLLYSFFICLGVVTRRSLFVHFVVN